MCFSRLKGANLSATTVGPIREPDKVGKNTDRSHIVRGRYISAGLELIKPQHKEHIIPLPLHLIVSEHFRPLFSDEESRREAPAERAQNHHGAHAPSNNPTGRIRNKERGRERERMSLCKVLSY